MAAAGFVGFKISVVVTRQNVAQLDAFEALADRYGAQLRLTRLRPSGRGADVWDELHPTAEQQRQLYDWLLAHGEQVLTGDSFFHLAGYGEALPGLNLCGAGRVVCLIDPVGDVYACPFVIHDEFRAGNVRDGRADSTGSGSRRSCSPSCAGPTLGGRVRVLRALRRLPGRLHGGQVLHRPAARRARPRVRARPRRDRWPAAAGGSLPPRPVTRPLSPDRRGSAAPVAATGSSRPPARSAPATSDPPAAFDAGRLPGCRLSSRSTPSRAGRTAPSRVVFGPHETNLADGPGHQRPPRGLLRPAGRRRGGVIVTETASVHPSDWPYERAPLAARLRRRAGRPSPPACRPHGTLVLAGLGHAGGQGSSAYSPGACCGRRPGSPT